MCQLRTVKFGFWEVGTNAVNKNKKHPKNPGVLNNLVFF
jgi:hypothetical protein